VVGMLPEGTVDKAEDTRACTSLEEDMEVVDRQLEVQPQLEAERFHYTWPEWMYDAGIH